MNPFHKAFRAAVIIGAGINWGFAVGALVFPRKLAALLMLGDGQSVWLFNYAVLLAILSCFYVPAARDPDRYRASAILLIVARFVPASTFFVGYATGFMPFGFVLLGVGDTTIGVAEAVLLGLDIRREKEDAAKLEAARSAATAARSVPRVAAN